MSPQELAKNMKFSLGQPMTESEFKAYKASQGGDINLISRTIDDKGNVVSPVVPPSSQASQQPSTASPFDLRGKLLSPQERLRKKIEEAKKQRTKAVKGSTA
jgi:hypothetical protein